MDFVKNTPWWLTILLYMTSLLLGIFVGAPIAVTYYKLTIPSEVAELFGLIAINHWYYLVGLSLLATFGFKYVRSKKNLAFIFTYLFFSVLIIPVVFYGVEVSNYYSYKT
jgi:hypothetical protein